MELEFQPMCLERYEQTVDAVLTQEVTAESIVPDAFPDVSRVVCTYGSACLTAKQILPRSAGITGSIHLHVFYIPEGERLPRSLALELPFQCNGDFPQISEQDAVHVSVISVRGEAQLLNPRKLLAKAEVRLQLRCYCAKQYDILCGMAQADACIQVRTEEYPCHSIVAALEKPFSFSDTLRHSQTRPVPEELLTYSVTPAGMEARYIGTRLICKGVMLLNGLYRSGGELFPMQFELPFSQILELEGSFQDAEPAVSLVLKQLQCTLRDGELDVTVDALLQAVIWSRRTTILLNDLYSTAAPLDVERTAIPLCTLAEHGSTRSSARTLCESGIPAKQILQTAVTLSPLTTQRNGEILRCTADALADILYLSEDDALCSITATLPVSCELEVSSDCACSCSCRTAREVLSVPVTGGIELRCEVDFDWQITREDSAPCVCAAKPGTADQLSGPIPSVTLRMVSVGESLWDIAKACRSTVQGICTANQLPSQTVECGTMLLIPTERG